MIKSTRLFLGVCLTILLTFTISSAFQLKIVGHITEVVDGERITVTALNNGSQFSVRLLGIDAPEHDQPVGKLAHDHLAILALGKIVTFGVTGQDAAGVFFSRVFVQNLDLGEQMVRDGAAWVQTEKNALDAETRRRYQDCERQAQQEHLGIWQDVNPTPPWEYIKQIARNRQKDDQAQSDVIRKQMRSVIGNNCQDFYVTGLQNSPVT